jgi:hypothetical protein
MASFKKLPALRDDPRQLWSVIPLMRWEKELVRGWRRLQTSWRCRVWKVEIAKFVPERILKYLFL